MWTRWKNKNLFYQKLNHDVSKRIFFSFKDQRYGTFYCAKYVEDVLRLHYVEVCMHIYKNENAIFFLFVSWSFIIVIDIIIVMIAYVTIQLCSDVEKIFNVLRVTILKCYRASL